MRTRRWVAGVGAGALLLVGVVAGGSAVTAGYQDGSPAAEVEDDDDPNATPVVGTPLLEPGIDLIRAQEAALEGQDGASVTAVELEGDDGTLIYEVELDNGVEVEVDAATGEVLESEQSDGDDDEADEADDESGDVDEADDAEGEEGNV